MGRGKCEKMGRGNQEGIMKVDFLLAAMIDFVICLGFILQAFWNLYHLAKYRKITIIF